MKKDLSNRVADLLRKIPVKHTVKSLLEKELGKEDFDRVIEYADEVILTHRPFSRAQALRWAFSWESTEEGYEYWERIHDQLFVKDMMDKKMSRVRKIILIGSIIIFLACMYKLFTL
tara:strand:- start:3441 stop:3791 length:351 start_codon:yes stop_codon:yes gene_type:complete